MVTRTPRLREEKEVAMDDERLAYETGVSPITGSLVQVRHATASDMYFVAQNLRKYGLGDESTDPADFVIATENGEIIGFVRARKAGGDFVIDAIIVEEEKRRAGIGSLLVSHVLETAPAGRIYAVTKDVEFFKEVGFAVVTNADERLEELLGAACGVKGGGSASILVATKAKTG
jgi:N-acetylglutamate synthase-like GNAT family acetyltransferase